jgi:hypothetical protein
VRALKGEKMYKVTVKSHHDINIHIHNFMSEPEARAYILGVQEWAIPEVKITLNGHRVNGADPKQRGG